MAIAKTKIWDEDWKTALAKNKEPIPEGAEVEVIKKFQNMYGDFVYVKYNGVLYSVKPDSLRIKPGECGFKI